MGAYYVAYFAACYSSPRLGKILLNAPDCAAYHAESLLLGSFDRDQDFAGSNRIDSNRLLHENMLSGIHGCLNMIRSEGRRSAKQDKIDPRINNLLIGVKPKETILISNFNSVC